MRSGNHSLIAAATIASFSAGLFGVFLADSRTGANPLALLKTFNALPDFLTATADGTDRLPEHRDPPAKHLTALGNVGDSTREFRGA